MRKIWYKFAAVSLLSVMTVCSLAGGNVQAKSHKKRQKTKISKQTVTAFPGMGGVTLKLRHNQSGKAVVWTSADPRIASVDAQGNLAFNREGNVMVRAKVGRRSYKCLVSVCDKKAYGAVQKALQFYHARNMRYSQGNRMGRRSADCSSFVGRCYLPQGYTMGGTSRWCNTAAGQALWATQNGKVVSNGKPSVGSKKMLPGDIVFYRKGHNGRYKNIYHVEIFLGYEYDGKKLKGYTMSSIIGNYPSILKRDYMSRRHKVAEVARPTK